MIAYDCIWLHMIAYDCICLHMIVYDCIWLYMIVYDCIWLHMIVYDCIWLYMIVYDCMWLYMIVCDCIWLHMIVYDCIWLYVYMCISLCAGSASLVSSRHRTKEEERTGGNKTKAAWIKRHTTRLRLLFQPASRSLCPTCGSSAQLFQTMLDGGFLWISLKISTVTPNLMPVWESNVVNPSISRFWVSRMI